MQKRVKSLFRMLGAWCFDAHYLIRGQSESNSRQSVFSRERTLKGEKARLELGEETMMDAC